MQANLKISRYGAVARVALNRPKVSNALSEEMKSELAAVFSDLNNESDVRSIILTAEGPTFCASGDVRTLGNPDMEYKMSRLDRAQELISTINSIEKPIIAAVRGGVVGVGWSMTLVCDYIIASNTAFFAQVFKNVGLIPDAGSLFLLLNYINPLKAKEFIFSGRRIDALEAYQLGLVSQLVDDSSLETKALELAEEIAAGPTLAFRLTKRLSRFETNLDLDAFFKLERELQSYAFSSADHAEGVQAFLQKRKPEFTGS